MTPENCRERNGRVGEIVMSDPANKRMFESVMSQGKAFTVKFKTQMFDVLTDEQWNRLQELIDNPPEYVKAYLKKQREARGESEVDKNSGGGWQLGPNSWKPGDPIPEEYRRERNTRGSFPRPAN